MWRLKRNSKRKKIIISFDIFPENSCENHVFFFNFFFI